MLTSNDALHWYKIAKFHQKWLEGKFICEDANNVKAHTKIKVKIENSLWFKTEKTKLNNEYES